MLTGKTAVITGGGTGIGQAIATSFAREGARVAITSRNPSHLRAAADSIAAEGLTVMAVQMDLREKPQVRDAVKKVVDQWGAIQILVNNASISGLSMIDDLDDSKWFDIVNTNLNGTYLVTKEILRHMPDHEEGRVINISSVLGKFGVPGYTAYCTTKHGIIGFTRALALELVNRGITVNAICPGWVETEMAALVVRDRAALEGITPEEFKAQAIEDVPIKRFLDPAEVACLVTYLASDLAKGITGQALNICGGQTMV